MLRIALLVLLHWRLTLLLPFVAGIVTLGIVFVIPKTYTASTLLMPPQKVPSGAAALLGEMSANLLGGADLGLRNPSELYVGILKARTISDKLIARFKLQEIYDSPTHTDTRLALARRTSIATARDGLISISVEDEDPERAAQIANSYAQELIEITQQLGISEASQRRQFYEAQLRSAITKLSQAETEFRQVQEKTGVLNPEGQARSLFEMAGWYRGQIAGKEVQLAALKLAANDTHPDVIRVRREVQTLRAQLAEIEKKNNVGNGELFVPSGKLPAAAEEYVRSLRVVKYQQGLFEFLSKQVEWAKIDEGRDPVVIQVVDRATPPDKKTRPKRLLIMITVVFLLHICAVMYVVAANAVRIRYTRDERFRSDFERLRKALLDVMRWHRQTIR